MRKPWLLSVVLVAGCNASSPKATCDSPQTQQALRSFFEESLAESEVPFWSESHPGLSQFREHSRAGRKVASCTVTLELDMGHADIGPDAIVTELQAARYLTKTGFGPLVHFDYPNVQRGLPTGVDGTRLHWDLKYSAKVDKVHSQIIVNIDEGEAISDYIGYYATLNARVKQSHPPPP